MACGFDLARTLDFLAKGVINKDVINKEADSKSVCVGGVEDLSRERSPIVRLCPFLAPTLFYFYGFGMRRGAIIAVPVPGFTIAANAEVISPQPPPQLFPQVPSLPISLRGAGDNRTNADP
jgi:hypothetical protein